MIRKLLTDYSPEMQAEFQTLAGNLTGAWENFRMDRSIDNRKTERAVYDALVPYEARVPREVRHVFRGPRKHYELAFEIRLRLEQIHNACFCDK